MKKFVFLIICISTVILSVCSCEAQPYIITQYGDDVGADSLEMCYSITAPNGELIMIDGGFPNSADSVREIIWENGGTVDAWIITHPHPDHAGAFNVIFENPDGIEIK